MDGPFYQDSRAPFLTGDLPSVTLSTTLKSLTPVANIPMLGSNYFNYVGKALRIRAFGRQTTGTTPGNLTMSAVYGTGGDNVGTSIFTSAIVGTASQTNVAFLVDIIIRCRSLGATGSLFGTGIWFITSTGFLLLPFSAPAPATVDLTANNVITLQTARSGTTAESMQLHDIHYESLN
jgi:hypothetical protein